MEPRRARVAALAALLAAGCAGEWTVLRASGPPSALYGARLFAVVSDFSSVAVDGERGEGARAPEVGIHDALLAALRTEAPGRAVAADEAAPGADVVTVAVRYLSIDPGDSSTSGNRDASVTARVRFLRGGRDLDEIEVRVVVEAFADGDAGDADDHATRNGRLRICGKHLGWRIARYLQGATR